MPESFADFGIFWRSGKQAEGKKKTAQEILSGAYLPAGRPAEKKHYDN